ncbi:hypothetical protein [Polyangium jinanense]|uniref:Uncharacterized protein n=1 Tax=Polyangium jinanense TaxID=2829994 RepID=A0A9X4AP82_9BACT|nr:hypothetical protein [Polyangium jinanense]MDC3953146.1 hypothetical protein [Polyangium jinanense]MDC3979733.1 hypothetical protein [Polyangium jinanense]
MALKNLQTEEMLQVSATWVDPQSLARAAILGNPDLSAKLSRIDEIHSILAAAAQPSKNPRLDEISAEQAKIDVRHDSIIRGIFGFLTATAELLGGETGADLIQLRDLLIPDGLPSVQKTYRAQAGQAQQLEGRLTPAIKARTNVIFIGQGPAQTSLTEYLDEWIALGKQLGEREDERGRLLAEQSELASGMSLVKARNRWIRVVNAFVADGELAELAPATEALVFGPLRDAEKKADARARSAFAASVPAKA